jgi:hypothetical protein
MAYGHHDIVDHVEVGFKSQSGLPAEILRKLVLEFFIVCPRRYFVLWYYLGLILFEFFV